MVVIHLSFFKKIDYPSIYIYLLGDCGSAQARGEEKERDKQTALSMELNMVLDFTILTSWPELKSRAVCLMDWAPGSTQNSPLAVISLFCFYGSVATFTVFILSCPSLACLPSHSICFHCLYFIYSTYPSPRLYQISLFSSHMRI